MKHPFFSLREKYPSATKGDEGLIDSRLDSKKPSPASLTLGCPLPKQRERNAVAHLARQRIGFRHTSPVLSQRDRKEVASPAMTLRSKGG